MKTFGRWSLVIFLGLCALYNGYSAVRILMPGNFSLGPTSVTLADLASGKYPDGGHFTVEDGYILPFTLYPEAPDEAKWIGLNPAIFQVVSAEDAAQWTAARAKGESYNPSYALPMMVEPKHLSRLWPDVGEETAPMDARVLEPIQKAVVGDVETIFHQNPNIRAVAPYESFQAMFFERHEYGPWNLTWRLLFVWALTRSAVKLLRTHTEVNTCRRNDNRAPTVTSGSPA